MTSLWRAGIGAILCIVILSELAYGMGISAAAKNIAILATICAMAAFAREVRGIRLVFLALSFAIGIFCLSAVKDPLEVLRPALSQASFITAFFCALTALQAVVRGSPAIHRAAMFLSSQGPGRRYLSLAFGTQIFTLLLNYGSIALLGSMAATSAGREADPEKGTLLLRRMLQAVQCGFAAAIAWSPFGFAVVLSVSLVPGASILPIMQAGLAVSLIMVATGWMLDRRLKTKASVAAAGARDAAKDIRSLLPLAAMLVAVAIPATALDLGAGIPPPVAMLALIPLLAVGWILWETPSSLRRSRLRLETRRFAFHALPGVAGEIVLLGTAGFMGSVGGALLAPIIAASGLDISVIPPRLLLVLPLIIIPLLGQLGVNPVLSATLLPHLLPGPGALGVSPTALAASLIAGWSLTIITSPFTASVAITARIAKVPTHVAGTRWNGAWFLVAASLTALWLQLLA